MSKAGQNLFIDCNIRQACILGNRNKMMHFFFCIFLRILVKAIRTPDEMVFRGGEGIVVEKFVVDGGILAREEAGDGRDVAVRRRELRNQRGADRDGREICLSVIHI